jgi:hypothetical protein
VHTIEPFYNWRHLYIASEDEQSPFHERIYSEFEFPNQIYNYLIHPQWDYFGSDTLYLKILYVGYDEHFCIIELIGEWNDLLYNDIMFLKRNVIEYLESAGINKFIFIGENVLVFHSDDDSYYEEWFEEVEDGWIVFVNFREHVIRDFIEARLDYYIVMDGKLNSMSWRKFSPTQLYNTINNHITKQLPTSLT